MSELSERFREEARRRSDRGFADGSTDGEKLCDEIDALEASVEKVRAIIPELDRARAEGKIYTYGAIQDLIRKALGNES